MVGLVFKYVDEFAIRLVAMPVENCIVIHVVIKSIIESFLKTIVYLVFNVAVSPTSNPIVNIAYN